MFSPEKNEIIILWFHLILEDDEDLQYKILNNDLVIVNYSLLYQLPLIVKFYIIAEVRSGKQV